VLKDAGDVDDGEFDWVKIGEERPSGLEVQPPRSAATPGKRQRAASVPDRGEIRGQKLPALLYNIGEEEVPEDCGSG
jgi:hypothetical protein